MKKIIKYISHLLLTCGGPMECDRCWESFIRWRLPGLFNDENK